MAQRFYEWPVVLYNNAITTDETEDYYAGIDPATKTMSMDDLIEGVLSERTVYQRDTVADIANKLFEKIVDYLCNGMSVNTSICSFKPSISGTFNARGEAFDEKSVIQCGVNITPNETLRKEISQVKIKVREVQQSGGARIDMVTDLMTGRVDWHVGGGHLIEVRGSKIKCVGQDGVSLGRLYVVGDLGVETEITALPYNEPSRVAFIFPDDLTEGEYTLFIETYFSASGNTPLKNPRLIQCPQPLVAE